MKWISTLDNKLVPILIGVSLTTLSLSVAILLYPMLGKVKCISTFDTKVFAQYLIFSYYKFIHEI